MSKVTLPPIEEASFDGHKEEAPIHRNLPLPNKCQHANIKYVSAIEIRCSCGAGWTGANIMQLYSLLKQD